MRQEEPKNRYRKTANTTTTKFDQSRLAAALMRALAKFPDARKAVIAEFDRIGGVLL